MWSMSVTLNFSDGTSADVEFGAVSIQRMKELVNCLEDVKELTSVVVTLAKVG